MPHGLFGSSITARLSGRWCATRVKRWAFCHGWKNLTRQRGRALRLRNKVAALFEMEQMLAGKQPDEAKALTGLNHRWPADCPAADQPAARPDGRGALPTIVKECHLPPVTSGVLGIRTVAAAEFGQRTLLSNRIDPRRPRRYRSGARRGHEGSAVFLPGRWSINSNEFGPRSASSSRRQSSIGTTTRRHPLRKPCAMK